MIETKYCDDWKKMVMIEKDCDHRNYDGKYCNDYRSIVVDGIGEVLYLLKKDPTSTKITKSDSHHRCFYAHKKHKVLNKWHSSS